MPLLLLLFPFLLTPSLSALLNNTILQNISHSDPSLGTFPQFYYEFTDYFDPLNGTVILKIGSEVSSLPPAGINDWFCDLARHFRSTVITLQHRYFGSSQPSNTSDYFLRYLTVDEALQDYRELHDRFISQVTNTTLSHLPWIVIGGSYPGLLSANIRKQWPERFQAAVSSAGVVFALRNYTDFDIQDAIAMGQECASLARLVRVRAVRLLQTDREYITKLFGVPSDISQWEFDEMIADTAVTGAQYSNIAGFCGPLVETLISGGDLLAAFAKAGLSKRRVSEGTAWFWMTCNELGYWQTSPGRIGIRGSEVSVERFEDQCRERFGRVPDVDKFNREHNVTKGNGVSHVAFITGSQDPWQWACVGEDVEVDEDNWVHTIKGVEVGHHREFDKPDESDPQDMKVTRRKIVEILEKWIGWQHE